MMIGSNETVQPAGALKQQKVSLKSDEVPALVAIGDASGGSSSNLNGPAPSPGSSGVNLSVRIMDVDGSIKVPEKSIGVSEQPGRTIVTMTSVKRERARDAKSDKRRIVKRIIAGVAMSLIAMCFILVAFMLHMSRHIDDSGQQKRTTFVVQELLTTEQTLLNKTVIARANISTSASQPKDWRH